MNRFRRMRRLIHAWQLHVEPLEPRHLLAGGAAVVLTQPIDQIVWQGRPTDVRDGYWNGRYESATPYGTPAIPPALLPVTWTSLSLGEGFFSLVAPGADPQLVEDWASQTPGVLAIRSGCERSSPESSTATTTFLAPVVMFQAAGAWMIGGAHCSG